MADQTHARHPEWFLPVSVFDDVIEYSFSELRNETPRTLHPVVYNNSIRAVGRAVCTLQLIIRRKVRSLFLENMRGMAGMEQIETYRQISEFMRQGYLHSDIFNTTLTCFAIYAELILFLEDFGFSIPLYWRHMPWVNIYCHRLKGQLLANGGWEELVETARRRFMASNLYIHTRNSFIFQQLPIPHAEEYVRIVPDRNDPVQPIGDDPDEDPVQAIGVAENPVEDPVQAIGDDPEARRVFVENLFGVAPSSSDLAMGILRRMYTFQPDMIPPDEEMFLFL